LDTVEKQIDTDRQLKRKSSQITIKEFTTFAQKPCFELPSEQPSLNPNKSRCVVRHHNYFNSKSPQKNAFLAKFKSGGNSECDIVVNDEQVGIRINA
jgi:hypothetical protein